MLPMAMVGPLERPLLGPEDLLLSPGSTTPGCNLSKHLNCHLQNRDAKTNPLVRVLRINRGADISYL